MFIVNDYTCGACLVVSTLRFHCLTDERVLINIVRTWQVTTINIVKRQNIHDIIHFNIGDLITFTVVKQMRIIYNCYIL